jgi:polyketide cyclase/dehydrase/lipid transport protein
VSTTYTVTASADIDAPADRVYAIIADYRNGHPHILPKQFRNLTVEQGGIGAGTIIRFEVRVFGQTQRFRAKVSEPEPGRVLVEENLEPVPSKTTFTVVKSPSGSGTRVTFVTETTSRGGLLGAVERFLSKRVMRKMYAEELSLLALRAREART